MYVCMYICMYACMHVCMYACMHVCMYACMHVCMYACMHVCMYACMHVCMYVCMYVCIKLCNIKTILISFDKSEAVRFQAPKGSNEDRKQYMSIWRLVANKVSKYLPTLRSSGKRNVESIACGHAMLGALLTNWKNFIPPCCSIICETKRNRTNLVGIPARIRKANPKGDLPIYQYLPSFKVVIIVMTTYTLYLSLCEWLGHTMNPSDPVTPRWSTIVGSPLGCCTAGWIPNEITIWLWLTVCHGKSTCY